MNGTLNLSAAESFKITNRGVVWLINDGKTTVADATAFLGKYILLNGDAVLLKGIESFPIPEPQRGKQTTFGVLIGLTST